MTATTTEQDFTTLVEPLRRELLAHCYRMTGSLHDAEDALQETYLRAWRAIDRFEARSSVRTWMYRIATNTCLTHLEGRSRRPLPTGLGAPAADPAHEPLPERSVAWLEPLPDAVVWSGPPSDPAAEAVTRDSVRLAFVAALQHLTAQQRAVLLLRDVLEWSAAETAQALGLTVAGVNSTLQRARAHVGRRDPDRQDSLDDERRRRLLDAYVDAFESYDIDGIVALMTQDVVWEMPPYPQWYRGRADVAALIGTWCPAKGPGAMRLLPTAANGQPAFGVYLRGDDGVHRAFQLAVLDLGAEAITHATVWFGVEHLTACGLPAELAAAAEPAAG
ncbi:sigma-70 family RNA polymerase sigma factor [Cellulomonas fimi]|uniref:RNA polymerase, sigma-24 subunit, ECF subfamily n=1 Tax=Cellulomonas fimi (strain ATCC 484 / DSM 20113 / JCM 1341 / CCUG 24087 / LMG 16345 / NBRC 15513 / NCIMB 8980 / NCTC 7547 / NRS-133) TaxID=590998 RepID=F4H3H3_CELFA|nr:sigma-70 family RNA polymerase sigma factor [Cellulomonas fimi]AEE46518.1 RNA polymerase, sigma-24 subunit, ECF subfamily [Cellulomonas fimi ATCC 484]NNH08753.1 sigma-70 family RNA polymerase sigma factor [Cellulomonas fimi]VEH33318.1 Sigma-24 [Cellulomonas fimi]